MSVGVIVFLEGLGLLLLLGRGTICRFPLCGHRTMGRWRCGVVVE